jgi:hypothetical protein
LEGLRLTAAPKSGALIGTSRSPSWSFDTCKSPEIRALSEIKLPDIEPSAKLNHAAAMAVLDWIRNNIYTNDNFKSGNKIRLSRVLAEEMRRVTLARREILAVRMAADVEPQKRGELALKAKGHNCSELASAAAWLGRKLGVTTHVVGNDGHEYAVFGELGKVQLPERVEDWPQHLVICDVYTNIHCSPQEYVPLLKDKLEKWTNQQKLLDDGDRWVKPNESSLIFAIADAPCEIYKY